MTKFNPKIIAIGCYQPKTKLTAQQIVDKMTAPAEVKEISLKLFNKSQFIHKSWATKEETPIFMMEAAFKDAIDQSGLDPADIDMLIYSGCLKGVTEPAQANLVANALGLKQVDCFDVSEACAGWVRAFEIASNYIQLGKAKNIAIISSISANSYAGDDSWTIQSPEQLDFKFAALTVGAAASVTLVSADKEAGSSPTIFRCTDTENVNACAIPTHEYANFIKDPMPEWRPGSFYAKSRRLLPIGKALYLKLLENYKNNKFSIEIGDILITHSVSKTIYEEGLKDYPELYKKHFSIYPFTGNITDNTIPVAIHEALNKGIIQPNSQITALINGSGDISALLTFRIYLSNALKKFT